MSILPKQDVATLHEQNSSSHPSETQTKFCSQCRHDRSRTAFVDVYGKERKTCEACRSYQRNYYVEVAGGYQYQKAKRQRIITQPRVTGQRICGRCISSKPTAEFMLPNGKTSRNCAPCREYVTAWANGKRASLSPEELSEVRRKSRMNCHKYRRAVLDHYGRVCVCCGEWREAFLAIDHIHGGGGKERREIGAGTRFYAWLINRGFPEGYRTLCTNCNFAMRFGHRCPHEIEREQLPFLDQPIPGFEFLGGTTIQ